MNRPLAGVVILAALVTTVWTADRYIRHAAAQQSAVMILQPDGPTFPSAQFTLPNGQKALTNSGPTASVVLGGSLVSLGTQMASPQTWTGAYLGEVFICGIGSPTASSSTMTNLRGVGIAVAANQVSLGVQNMGTGLLSATNQINIGCTPFN